MTGVVTRLKRQPCVRGQVADGHPPMPLTMHMIHPRVSLLTPAASMVGRPQPSGPSVGW